MVRQYSFNRWGDGNTSPVRDISVANAMVLYAVYEELMASAIVKISGLLDKQDAPGKTVTLSITGPGLISPQVLMALTDALGNWRVPGQSFMVAGTYTIVGSVPEDSIYQAVSTTKTFSIPLTTRNLAINVVVT